MPRMHIIYDPSDKLELGPVDQDINRKLGIKTATLSVADEIEDIDRYAIARRLAELLLEQL